MAIEVTMPRLSDTMEVGTVVKWNVKEGDSVSTGDVIADIETDKATMELQSFDDGVVAKLAVEEGQSVSVGSIIVILAEPGEDVAAAASSTSTGASASKAESGSDSGGGGTAVAAPPSQATPAPSSNGTTNGHERVFASPLAKKIAKQRGIDLGALTGTGPSGRITRKDVEAVEANGTVATSAPAPEMPMMAPAALESRTVPLNNMRRTIARRLVESKTTIPHYQVTVEVAMDALLGLRSDLNRQLESQGVKLTVNDFLVRACAIAMQQHPYVNSRWSERGNDVSIEIIGDVNVGVAIALPEEKGGGLVVATLRHADRLGLRQISNETKRLAKKAREKGLTVDEMSDSTFTISNLGMFGVDHFTAIINPPNAAILAVGGAIERPVVRDGEIVVGHVMSMTMSSDHRIIDGAMAAQYLNTVKSALEQPATLLV
ncbi:MAG: 2-oxo acid dehydrogenase subunit E2 [Phycisphaerales bacterium]|nr:2-oxo acid dehydrogenase subunit E2 [Phycisphaerales bacterium]